MQSIPGGNLDIDRRTRLSLPYYGLSYRDAADRVCDFNEVVLPFNEERARYEASRCIHCPDPAPCVIACPVDNDIPSAMWLIEIGEFEKAYSLYLQTSSLPEICGRVCPHDELCQGSCVLSSADEPVLTGALEAFVADISMCKWRADGGLLSKPQSKGKKVAVVGAGPAGLGCADVLIDQGYEVTVFDANPFPGGLLMYGIPNFKLPREVVRSKIRLLQEKGVKFEPNVFVGKDKTIAELQASGYESVFIGVGTWQDATMGTPGEDLPGVYKGSEFLILANTSPEYIPAHLDREFEVGKKLVVIGGGDTASDCLRAALRLNAEEVICAYRRTEAEMPGSAKDRKLAKEEGAQYQFLTQPVKFIPDENGHLKAIECIRNRLGEPDHKGRRRPVAIEGTNFIIETDMAVLAIGYWPDKSIGETTPGLEVQKWGEIVTNGDDGATSLEGIYAGGDAVTGPDLVVTAMAAGRKAARAIAKYLDQKSEK